MNLSPENRAEVRDELQRQNLAPEVRAKIEAALGGVEVGPKKRARLEEQLKREESIGRRAPRNSRTFAARRSCARRAHRNEDATKDLPQQVRARIQDALKRASPSPAEEPQQPGQTTPEPRENDMPHLESGSDKNASTPFEKWIETRAKEKMGADMEQRWGCLSRRCLAICLT